ncbi:MAG: ABC transporter ATP-binding protein [Acidobacteriota bacterium]
MQPIVDCQRLGKRYQIRHESDRQSYVALRDVIASALKAPFVRRPNVHGAIPAREDFWALRDVSFQVASGEVVGIIGRNGAGKSTLLKILSRITEPSEGRLTLSGRVASLLEVGTGFHPELTGRENIFLNGAILGMTRVEIVRKFDEIVAFAEVDRFLDTPVKRYSSGMYVRLAFAVAAHLEPEILVVDEVLAVGDAEFQKKCLGKMREVSQGGRTVLFVSHNMAAIQTLCSRAIVLEGGRKISDSDPATSIAAYLSRASEAGQPTLRESVSIGSDLELVKFEFSPNPLTSGSSARFTIEMRAREAARIGEVAVLFYSAQEMRVGIVDLRSSGLPASVAAGESWSLSGTIKNIPLVEGDYRVGLYVVGGTFTGNLFDLVELTVAARAMEGGHAPYSAGLRGVVEFDVAVDGIA